MLRDVRRDDGKDVAGVAIYTGEAVFTLHRALTINHSCMTEPAPLETSSMLDILLEFDHES